MTLVNQCPDIPDNWRGGITDAARLLGLHPDTLRKYARIGRRKGGLDAKPKTSGKRGYVFSGKELKRFWNSHL